VQGLRNVDGEDEFDAMLREVPPANPYLATRWRELGMTVPGASDEAAAVDDDAPEWGVG
jgi:hypothetical protein